MPYDRDEIVTSLTSFYKFLTYTHIPESALKLPPEGGWPELTDEWLSFINKSSAVNDLIRHLPYIEHSRGNPYEICRRSYPIDFMGGEIREFRSRGVAEPQESASLAKVPETVLTISIAPGRDGSYLMVDTERGTITVMDGECPTKSTELSQKVPRDPDDREALVESWREEATYYITEFFEMTKDKYRTFEMVAISKHEVRDGEELEKRLQRVKEIYYQHGWLTENYRKDECLEAVERALEEDSEEDSDDESEA